MEDSSTNLEKAVTTRLPDRVILYDGVCGMCNWIVDLLIRLDRDQAFHFAPLQGETCATLRRQHGEIPDDLDTVVYVERGRVRLRSHAFFAAATHLRWPWRAATWLRVFPAFVTDAPYRLIAKYRYAMFGKHETCRLPTPDERARFLP